MMPIKAILHFVLCILASFIPYYKIMIKETDSVLFSIAPSVSTHEMSDNGIDQNASPISYFLFFLFPVKIYQWCF